MRRLVLVMLVFALAGCSPWRGNYRCQGYPEGVQCQSVRETYAQTNYQEALTRNSQGNHQEIAPVAAGNAPGPEGAPVQGMGYAGPLPLRTPAQVIRIWVAPWESQDGRLHLPNYIYGEVEARQWSIGERRMRVAPAITALETVSPPETGRDRRPAPREPAPGQASLPKKGQEKTLFPDKIQRPPVHNQFDLQQLQQMPGRVQAGEGGMPGKTENY